MAKYEKTLFGELPAFVDHLDRSIKAGSLTATLEDGSFTHVGDAAVAVRVYERYSAWGGNRVSLNITVVAWGTQLYVCAITSGGTDALFMKVMPVGEQTFLDAAADAIDSFRPTTCMR